MFSTLGSPFAAWGISTRIIVELSNSRDIETETSILESIQDYYYSTRASSHSIEGLPAYLILTLYVLGKRLEAQTFGLILKGLSVKPGRTYDLQCTK